MHRDRFCIERVSLATMFCPLLIARAPSKRQRTGAVHDLADFGCGLGLCEASWSAAVPGRFWDRLRRGDYGKFPFAALVDGKVLCSRSCCT